MSYSNPTMIPTGGVGDRRDLAQPALHDAPKEVCLGKDLMEDILSPANLKQAWRRVKSNRGAPGIDGLRIEDFPAYACEHWPAIRQTLSEGRYQPQAVRRVPEDECPGCPATSAFVFHGGGGRSRRRC